MRAPSTIAVLERNPYRRETIIKKWYGKNAAERKSRFNEDMEELEALRIQRDREDVEKDLEAQKTQEQLAQKRADYGRRR